MITVSDELKSAFNSGTQKDLTLAFSDGTSLTNENIVAESMAIEQTLCDEQQLTFGLCNASSFSVRILNTNSSRVGLTVTPTITAYDDNNTAYSMQLGVFTIVEDKVTDDRLYRNIKAYDSLYGILNSDYSEWYKSLTFPMTLKNFRDSFFSHIGITQESITLINDTMTVEKTVDADVFSGSKILKAICEINAVFGCINAQGNFRYVPFASEGGLFPDEDVFPEDDLYPEDGFDVVVNGTAYTYISGSFVYQDYTANKITGVSIVEDENDTSVLYGTDTNLYKITGNYLLFGKSASDLQTVASNFLNFVDGFLYTPAKIKMRAMPWVELGDIIGVIGQQGNAVFPTLKRKMSGITALYDEYEAKGTEHYTFSANTTSDIIEKIKSRSMKMERTVDGFYQEYKEFEEATDGTLESHSSRIEQNADNIILEVERATGSESSLSSRIEQNASSIVLRVNSNGQLAQVALDGSGTSTQIKIDADNLDLSANDVFNIMSGGTLNLSSKNISISSNNFSVDSSGNLTASNVNISGTVTASGGKIGNLSITNGGLSHGNFTVDGSGNLTASNVNIQSGTIGGQVSITSDGIVSGNVVIGTKNNLGGIWVTPNSGINWYPILYAGASANGIFVAYFKLRENDANNIYVGFSNGVEARIALDQVY